MLADVSIQLAPHLHRLRTEWDWCSRPSEGGLDRTDAGDRVSAVSTANPLPSLPFSRSGLCLSQDPDATQEIG